MRPPSSPRPPPGTPAGGAPGGRGGGAGGRARRKRGRRGGPGRSGKPRQDAENGLRTGPRATAGGAAIARLAAFVVATIALVLASSATALGSGVTVAPGDTLSAIAARHGTTVAALARANGIADPDVIRAGRRLLVPAGAAPATGGGQATPSGAGGAYRIRPGDTLGAIAARAGTTPAAIAALNGIANPNLIVAGRTLRLPGPGTPPAPPPAPVRLVVSSSGGDVAGLISASAARHGVDPALARAVAWQESGFSQSAVSSAGAVGVMQLLPSTARWFGPAVLGRRIDPHDLRDNIDGGVAYLAWLQRQAGDTSGALAAYYQGLSALRRHGPYPGTREYVSSVMAHVGRV